MVVGRSMLLCAAVGFGALVWGSHVMAGDGILAFTEEAVERGLIYELPEMVSGSQGYGPGVAIVDLNGNGHNDIVLMGKASGLVGFFENDGTGHFIDRSFVGGQLGDKTPKLVLQRPSGIAVADYNGNGKLDIYFTQQMNQNTGETFPSVLFRNEGDFTFTDVAEEAGVINMGNGEGAAWGDFDNDGWLDLYIANYTFPTQQDVAVHRNRLYRNLGDGTFEEVSIPQGVDDEGMSFTAVFTDINRNGWLDIYVANDRGHMSPSFPPNQLWRNDKGQYENICDTSGACLALWSMCVAAGDFNGNGYPDFYVTNIAHPAGYNGWNPLIVNQGDETFIEQCTEAGVCQLITSWAGIFFDYSNNGWLDLYVCNQWQSNNLFANDGRFPTTLVTTKAGVGGNSGVSYNAAVGDVTGNGALDILLNNTGADGAPKNVELFINHEGATRNWIRFNMVGYDGNVHAIGGNIEVVADGHTQWREIYAGGNNYKAQNELVYHFGLADADIAEEIIARWPGLSAERTLTNYPVNETWTIYPPDRLGDYTNNGAVNVQDLLGLITNWGVVSPGAEMMDINGDGVIDVKDLLLLINMWTG